ncbi:unnamed protein product [Paramecium pentaurelia]|uniref:Uncharacterized protein n=1 Tax=Paramecium pentaurelia TaxID=43138 RepID=A0A8S1VKB4_9CILI|nr:unnamed protein product [Paramecium pentaurelia]
MEQQVNQLSWKVQQNPKELDLSYCVFLQDIEFITYLKSPQAKQMQSLNLSHTLLSDASLLQLSFLDSKSLKFLNLSYCVNFTEGAIVNLLNSETIVNVEVLDLSGNQLSDVCLKFVLQPNKMKYLASIILNDIKKGQQGFSYKLFEILSQTNLNKSLLNLSVGNSFVQPDQLQMTKAQTIMNTFFNRIMKEDHTYFYQLSLKGTSIQTLTLFKCELLTNKFIKMLCRNIIFLSSIKVLNIGHCKLLTDKICYYLSEAGASVQKLVDLELLGLNITSDGLDKIIKSKSLKLNHLGLAMCEDIQSDAIKTLMDSKFGKTLTSLEVSGSYSQKSQIVGLFSQEQIIWKDFNLKTIYIELFLDQGCYYQHVGKQQLQFQKQQQLNQNLSQLDPYYKTFFETHMYTIIDQIIFIKKIKVVIKVQYTDEDLIAQYLTNFIEQNNLLDNLLTNDNQLFVNNLCILSYVLQSITKASAKIYDVEERYQQNNQISIIQINYLDPIEKEKINVSQIRNLVLMKQDLLRDEDLALVGRYSETIFSQLSYIQIKGCKQITIKGLQQLGERLLHQLQFLDVRKTQIKLSEYSQILNDFINLTSFNNNKIQLDFNQKNTKDDLVQWLNLLFRLLSLKKLSIKNTNKQSIFNMFLMRFVAQMVKNNHLSMKKLYLQCFLNIADFQLYSEESLTELCESIQLSFNIKTFYLEISGLIKHQFIIDVFNTLINTQITNLNLQLENCNIIDEIFINKQTSIHYFKALEFSTSNLTQLDIILYNTQQLEDLTAVLSLNENKIDSLIYLFQNNQLINLKIELQQAKIEQFLDILIAINPEKIKTAEFIINNILINEIFLQKLQEFLLKCKRLIEFTISMIGCGCTKQMMDKYFKSNLQIFKIPQLKFYY